jgi:hypothetical protein
MISFCVEITPDDELLDSQGNFVRHQTNEKLRGQRRHRKVKTFDAQRWQTEQDADACCGQAATDEGNDERNSVDPQLKVVGGVSANRHEGSRAERQLAGVAGQDIQSKRRQRKKPGRESGSPKTSIRWQTAGCRQMRQQAEQ